MNKQTNKTKKQKTYTIRTPFILYHYCERLSHIYSFEYLNKVDQYSLSIDSGKRQRI